MATHLFDRRHLVAGFAAAVLLVGGAGPAAADDKIIFRNQSPYPVRVDIYSDEGRYRGSESFGPWESSRLTNGKGKTRLAINGRRFRVSDLGYRDDGRWIVTWRDGSRAPIPRSDSKPAFPPRYRHPF